MRLLREVGEVCESYQDRVFRNLAVRRIQLDELWGFNYCKAKNVTPEISAKVPGAGDVWLWVAVDAEAKLVPCWRLGDRNAGTALEFVHDLASRLRSRVQVTSDGHKVYLEAMESASAPKWTMRCSSSTGLTHTRMRKGTARRNASARNWPLSAGSQTHGISALALSSGRTGLSARQCAGTRDCRADSPEKSRTTGQP